MSTRPVIADMLADAQAFLDGGVDELTALLDEVASYGDLPVPALVPRWRCCSPVAPQRLLRARSAPPSPSGSAPGGRSPDSPRPPCPV